MELKPPSSNSGSNKPVFFENPDMDYMAQHFVGNLNRYFQGIHSLNLNEKLMNKMFNF